MQLRRLGDRALTALLAVTLVGAAGCRSGQPVKPFADRQALQALDEQEDRVWIEAEQFDEYLHNTAATYEDGVVTEYVQAIMDRLYPEFQGRIRVHLLSSPVPNAFALPNGSIYFNIGLLAMLENEAQLATIVAHEGAHFTHRHSYQTRQGLKNTAAGAMIAVMVGVPPIIATGIGGASVAGHSRDLEREADQVGFERLARAGYDVTEAVKPFEFLAIYTKASGDDYPGIYASHPRLEERIESYNELIRARGEGGGRVEREPYLERTDGLRLTALEKAVDTRRGMSKNIIALFAEEEVAERFPPAAWFYLGEAYRQRGEEGDEQHALYAYQQALQRAPGFAPTHRVLGVHYLKRGDYEQAAAHLREYLRLAPSGRHAAYVRSYLSKLEQEENKP